MLAAREHWETWVEPSFQSIEVAYSIINGDHLLEL